MEKVKIRVYAEYYQDFEFERKNESIRTLLDKAESLFLQRPRNDFEGLKYKDVSDVVVISKEKE